MRLSRARGRRRTDDFNAAPVAATAATARRVAAAPSEGPILWFPGVGWDTLAGTDLHLATELAEQGVRTVGIRFLGQLHGFWRHDDVFDAAEPLTRTLGGFLRSHP